MINIVNLDLKPKIRFRGLKNIFAFFGDIFKEKNHRRGNWCVRHYHFDEAVAYYKKSFELGNHKIIRPLADIYVNKGWYLDLDLSESELVTMIKETKSKGIDDAGLDGLLQRIKTARDDW